MKTMKTFYTVLVVLLASATSAYGQTKILSLNDSSITVNTSGTKTKIVTVFNDYGKKTNAMNFEWDGPNSKWVKTLSTDFTYNTIGLVTSTAKTATNITTGVTAPSSRSTPTYNEFGNEVLRLDESYNKTSSEFRPNLKTESFYDVDGKKLYSTATRWNSTSSEWILESKSVGFSDTLKTDSVKLYKALSTTKYLYNTTTATYTESEKSDIVYNVMGVKTGTVAYSWDTATSKWLKASKMDFIGDSITGTTLVKKYNFTDGVDVLASTETRYFSQKTVQVYTGVNNSTLIQLTLSPNPVKDQLNVSGLEKSAIISILDLTGKAVIRKSITNNESISLGALTPGIYIAKVTNLQGELVYRTKLIKQ